MRHRGLWVTLTLIIAGSFLVLGYYGREIYRLPPPNPERVVTTDVQVLPTGKGIRDGQKLVSVWGHGSYVVPDWSSDWLHGEARLLLGIWAGKTELEDESQAALQRRLQDELRTNTYDAATGDLLVSSARAAASEQLGKHSVRLFGNDPQIPMGNHLSRALWSQHVARKP
jgi:nitric oxide reductase subunit B